MLESSGKLYYPAVRRERGEECTDERKPDSINLFLYYSDTITYSCRIRDTLFRGS